ncbi:MAG: hypothetical protein OEZ02_03705 [Anaerolineae bacterium]|nr:hypothetical protein [Anaerolineae bacterium]
MTALAELLTGKCKQAGHIPCLAYAEIARAGMTGGEQWMPWVREQVRGTDLVLLAYTAELRGGLIEAGIAYAAGVPVWLLARSGERVSNSARGCAQRVIAYESLEALGEVLEEVLMSGSWEV